MWKYNAFDIGDLVGHKRAETLLFEVIDILPEEPDEIGKYLYCCSVVDYIDGEEIPLGWATAEEVEEYLNDNSTAPTIFKYAEVDLFRKRASSLSIEQLEALTNDAVIKEEYEKANRFKKMIEERKTV